LPPTPALAFADVLILPSEMKPELTIPVGLAVPVLAMTVTLPPKTFACKDVGPPGTRTGLQQPRVNVPGICVVLVLTVAFELLVLILTFGMITEPPVMDGPRRVSVPFGAVEKSSPAMMARLPPLRLVADRLICVTPLPAMMLPAASNVSD
jgi:hypothetical protein